MSHVSRRIVLATVLAIGLVPASGQPGIAAAPPVNHALTATVSAPSGTPLEPFPAKKPHRPAAHAVPLSTGVSDPANYRLDPGVAAWYRERGASEPTTDHPVYCHGYGCEFQTPIAIDDNDLATLRRIFAGHADTAAAERGAISEAVRWWERRASPLLGGPPREHGSDIMHAHHHGATDCIDEATNSTTILVVLARRGFLKHHTVERPASRGIIVNAHSTAIIHEIGGADWAVDMWMHNMGEAPDIMTESQWMSQA
jgi:hypothetical protein